jgi:hypothetical protein
MLFFEKCETAAGGEGAHKFGTGDLSPSLVLRPDSLLSHQLWRTVPGELSCHLSLISGLETALQPLLLPQNPFPIPCPMLAGWAFALGLPGPWCQTVSPHQSISTSLDLVFLSSLH